MPWSAAHTTSTLELLFQWLICKHRHKSQKASSYAYGIAIETPAIPPKNHVDVLGSTRDQDGEGASMEAAVAAPLRFF